MITLPPQTEATQLITFKEDNETFQATPATHKAWQKMKAALPIKTESHLSSSPPFRSIERQQDLVDAKRKKGIPDSEIFKILARPGFSEHHTGRCT